MSLTHSILAALRADAPELLSEADERELHRLRAASDRSEAEAEEQQFDAERRALGLPERLDAPGPCHLSPFGEPDE